MDQLINEKMRSVFNKNDISIKMLQSQVVKAIKKPSYERSELEIQRVIDFFQYFNMFKNVKSAKDLAMIARCATYQRFPENSLVFDMGDPPTYYYVLVKGRVIGGTKKLDSPMGKFFNELEVYFELSSGCGFGEIAIIANDSRSVTIQAKKDTDMLLIKKDDYIRIVCPVLMHTIDTNLEILKSIEAFKQFETGRLREFCSFMFENNYRSDMKLSLQDKYPRKVFIIKVGKIDCFHTIYKENVRPDTLEKYKHILKNIKFPIRMKLKSLGWVIRKFRHI
jgi:hypothetical protein